MDGLRVPKFAPNFFIIGAPRSGTTYLWEGLNEHPDIYLSSFKEPHFFSIWGEPPRWKDWKTVAIKNQRDVDKVIQNKTSTKLVPRTFKDYENIFAQRTTEAMVGEASTLYLWDPECPVRIKHYVPDAKLIAILRNPVDRAYSHFLLHRMMAFEPFSTFEGALDAEQERREQRFSPFFYYFSVGLYSEQVKRYKKLFGEQLLVLTYDDLRVRGQDVFRRIFEFLGVASDFTPNSRDKINTAVGIRNERAWQMLHSPPARVLRHLVPQTVRSTVRQTFSIDAEALDPSTRRRLISLYRQDIIETANVTGFDLDEWL